MKYKIRIKTAPSMAYGGQTPNYALDLGQRQFTDFQQEDDQTQINNTLQEVPRYMANIEAEQGETALGDFNQDGNLEHMKIGGKRHSQGGTPLNVPEGTFIFSDTKAMRLGGQDLAMFGKTVDSKKKYTPAQLAKQYDLQKYQSILDDPYADNISKRTAEMMIANNQKKLGQLAMVQESKKGFPAGIPDIAMPLMQAGQEQQNVAYGGFILPKAVEGMSVQGDSAMQKAQMLMDKYPWLKPWLKSNTPKGRKSPTGKTTTYNDQVNNLYKDIADWENIAGRKFNNLQDMQGFTYSTMDQSDPAVVENMWKEWGHTAKSKNNDVDNFADRYMGARTAQMLRQRPTQPTVPDTPSQPPVDPGTPSAPPRGTLKPVVKWKCGPNGPQQVTVMGGWDQGAANNKTFGTFDPKATSPSMQYTPQGLGGGGATFDSYEAALAACKGAPVEETPGTTPDNPNSPTAPGITPGDFNPGSKPVPFQYMTPDKLSTLNAANNLLNTKKYMPWEAPITGYMADPTFLNPDRELAYNSEQARTQMDMNAMFSGPQSLGARNSAVQGAAAQNAANILGKVNNQNVGIANQFAGINAEMMNQIAQAQGARATRLFDKNTIANQQYDNEMTLGRNELVKSGINAWNNRSKLYAENVTNKYFMVDPTTGKMVQRTSINPFDGSPGGNSGSSVDWNKYQDAIFQLKKDAKNQGIDITDAMAKEIVNGRMGLGRVSTSDPYSKNRTQGLGSLNRAVGANSYYPYDPED